MDVASGAKLRRHSPWKCQSLGSAGSEDRTRLRKRFAKLDPERSILLGDHLHGRLKEAVKATFIGLCAVERDVGALQKVIRRKCILVENGDPDACAYDDLLVLQLIGLAQATYDVLGEAFHLTCFLDLRLEDGKLVATEASDVDEPVQTVTKTIRHIAEELVSCRVAQCVDVGLEPVQIW